MQLPGPIKALLQSRKFLILVLDTLISSALFFSAKYLAPGAFDDIKFLIGILQPVCLMVIYSIAHEDSAEKARSGFVSRWVK